MFSIKDLKGLELLVKDLDSTGVIGLDIETTSLSPYEGEIRLIQIGTDKEVFVIDLFKTKTLGPLLDFLKKGSQIKILHNARFDQAWLLHKYGIELWPIFDTFRASKILYNGIPSLDHDLWSVMRRELKEGVGIASDEQRSDWSVPELSSSQLEYAALDVKHLTKLRQVLKDKLDKKGLLGTALTEFGVVLAEASIELKGFYLDKEEWVDIVKKNEFKKDLLSKRLLALLPNPSSQVSFSLPGMGSDFNLDSNSQMLESLRKVGVPIEDTQEETLILQSKKFPIVNQVLDYREVSKQLSSFGLDYLKHINKITGRIHANFFPFTGAGRYSCSKPNLAQIPRAAKFRSCFRAPEGRKLCVADYAAIEMRVAAEISNDWRLIEAFRGNKDIHAYTASLVQKIPESEVSKLQRQQAKSINFGLLFGMGSETLVRYAKTNYGVEMSLKMAEAFRREFFEAYKGLKKWHKDQINFLRAHKKVRTIGGRLRYLDPEKHYAEALNTSVQGTAADGLKNSLRVVHKKLNKDKLDAFIVHHVHDELIIECAGDDDTVNAVSKHLHDGMVEGMSVYLKKVPVVVEPAYGNSWGDAK